MIVWSALTVAAPCAGWLPTLTVSASPSTSLSFASTAIVAAVSSAVVRLSLPATGGSLTGVTAIATVATFESSAPSFAL